MRSIIRPYPIFCRLVGSWPKCNATFQGPLRQLSAAALTQIPQQASKDGHLHTKLQRESNPECSKIYFIMGRSWWESVNEIRPAKNPQAFPCNGIQFTTVYAVASVASHFEVAGPCLLIPKPKNNTKHPSLSLWDLAVCSNPKVALHAAPLARAHQATLHAKHPELYFLKKMENMNRWEGPDWCHSRLRRVDWMESISPFELQESLLQTFPSCPTGDIYGTWFSPIPA